MLIRLVSISDETEVHKGAGLVLPSAEFSILNTVPGTQVGAGGQKAETRGSKTCVLPADVPFGSFQVVIGLLQLPDILLQLVFNCFRLGQVILQGGNLPVAFRMLRLKLLLRDRTDSE